MLRIGVVGAGHLGKIHIRILKECDFAEFIGFYDANEEVAADVANSLGANSFASIDDLILACDVVSVVTPTLAHYEIAQNAMRNFKHVFIEKPIAHTIKESQKLISLSVEANVKVQIGHVERFNPGFIDASKYLENPMFIETHR